MENPEVEIFKVWPTQYDREMFTDIINLGGEKPCERSIRIIFTKLRTESTIIATHPRLIAAYGYFYDQIRHQPKQTSLTMNSMKLPSLGRRTQPDRLSVDQDDITTN